MFIPQTAISNIADEKQQVNKFKIISLYSFVNKGIFVSSKIFKKHI